MIPTANIQTGKLDSTTRKLLAVARSLSPADQQTLLRFAQFLQQDTAESVASPPVIPDPEPIPRPAEESVIKAMRRLSKTYPMLNRGPLLNETSALMAQHVMQGRSAVEVIDELEEVFARHYQKLRSVP